MLLVLMASQVEVLPKVSSLESLFMEYWDFVLESWPSFATYLGDHGHDDKLEDLSQQEYDKWTSKAEDLLRRLGSIPRESLSAKDRIDYELFSRELSQRVGIARFRPNLLPLNQLEAPHINLPQLTAFTRFSTVVDYENYLKRIRAFRRQADQIISSLEEGVRCGILLPRVVVGAVLSQIRTQLVSSVELSPLYGPAQRFPKDFSQSDKDRLSENIKNSIVETVLPSYRKLFEYLENQYLPISLEDVGYWALPNGDAWYRFLVKSYTTTNLTPEQIHTLGLEELSKIQQEMKLIMRRVGFDGDLQAFSKYLRSEPKFQNTSAESILFGYRQFLKDIDSRITELFGTIPSGKCEVKEIESFRAKEAPVAHYYQASDDGTRPAYFYANTYKPETRLTFQMEAIAYHEAVPGHHFQIALQQELKDQPEFRRNGGYVWPGYLAFMEGWGLYSEAIPKELGLYKDPYSDFGRLEGDAFRAARLVVDTGLHAMKWTRDQAIRFLEENTAMSSEDIIVEVDRYIVLPGQALAYKIGQLKIFELRSRAEKTLGGRFDIRAFHDELLRDGALPLDLIEDKMQAWISAQS
jgi:uncharacterized protein (DUF885 family)